MSESESPCAEWAITGTVSAPQYVTEMVRRLAAFRLMEPALDEDYRRVKASACGKPREAESEVVRPSGAGIRRTADASERRATWERPLLGTWRSDSPYGELACRHGATVDKRAARWYDSPQRKL